MTATDSYLLLRAFCDELARCGVTEACTSPGSRSTPLVLSLAREPGLRAWSHVDERTSGFFALGSAKATGRPAVVAVTSGTAAAELAPAVIEAAQARVPMIVLTADRPPELREVGAGQAIDQLKLYGGAAKWFFEVGVVGEATAARVRWMRTLACRAVWTALDGAPGVVHLNLPLREPLVLDAPLPAEDPASGRPDGRPWVTRLIGAGPGGAGAGPGGAGAATSGAARALDAGAVAAGAAQALDAGAAAAAAAIPIAPRGVVVAGRVERGAEVAPAVAALAARAGWALLADPLSGARRGPAAVAHYDTLLRDAGFLAGLPQPELVLRIGDLPTSKPLRAWLAGLDAGVPQIALDPERTWQDPDGVVSARLDGDLSETLAALARALDAHTDLAAAGPYGDVHSGLAAAEPPAAVGGGLTATRPPDGAGGDPTAAGRLGADPSWLARWRDADARAAAAISATIAADETLNEPRVAAELTELLGPAATLFVAASMPIRDVETFAAVGAGPRVLSNRGANGIDGTVATALGAAATGAAPVVLLVGDVTLAYDLGALLSARRHALDLTIVLVNNDGGGIFHFLPVATQADAFEEHVATPHGLDFATAAALYGARHVPVATVGALRAAVTEATARGAGVTIVELRTDRDENVRLHRRVWAAVGDALAAEPTA